MKKHTIMATLITALIGMGVFTAQAAEEKVDVKKQTTCPVMGGEINKAQYADVKGKRIYVCCYGCIATIKASPEKYIKQLETEGITLDKAEAKKEKAHDHSAHGHKH